jgi:ankyrin repeat protein
MKILARNPDLAYTNAKQQTVAHLAAKSDYPDAVKIFAELIRCGSNVNARDAKGTTPLQLARATGNEEMAAILRDQIPGSAVTEQHKTIAPGSLSVFSHHDKTGRKNSERKLAAQPHIKIPGKQ